MKLFSEWLSTINESVTFSVSGFRAKSVENLFYLGYSIENQLSQSFGPAYHEGFRHERFTIDGFDTDAMEGIMNFYTGGLSEEMLQKALKAIPYYLQEKGVKVTGPVKQETSNMFKTPVYRFPVKLNDSREDKPPELNVANGNAQVLVNDILGISKDGEYYAGHIDVRELMMKIGMVSDFTKEMSMRAPTHEKGTKGAEIYGGGLSSDQIQRYLDVLEQMCRWAIENNYDAIQWG